jgi:hypothetical protein
LELKLTNKIDNLLERAASRGFMLAKRSAGATWREWARHLIRTGAPAVCAYLGRRTTVIEVDLAGTGRELTAEGLLRLWDLFEAEGRPLYARANSTLGFVRVPTETAEHVAGEVVKIIAACTRPLDCCDSVEDAADEIEKQNDTAYLERRGYEVYADSHGRPVARAPGKRARSLKAAVKAQLASDGKLMVNSLMEETNA